jgi:hypothetical protein
MIDTASLVRTIYETPTGCHALPYNGTLDDLLTQAFGRRDGGPLAAVAVLFAGGWFVCADEPEKVIRKLRRHLPKAVRRHLRARPTFGARYAAIIRPERGIDCITFFRPGVVVAGGQA